MSTTLRLLAGTAAVASIDLLTKFAAVASTTSQSGSMIVPTTNQGLSFGVARLPSPITVACAALALISAGYVIIRATQRGVLRPWIGAFVLGGAAANLVDRAAFSAVHDFFAAGPVVFNLADVALIVGLGGGMRCALSVVRSP
jgi:lipoprotein signal peptidase